MYPWPVQRASDQPLLDPLGEQVAKPFDLSRLFPTHLLHLVGLRKDTPLPSIESANLPSNLGGEVLHELGKRLLCFRSQEQVKVIAQEGRIDHIDRKALGGAGERSDDEVVEGS
jgi:hypothetical protein